MDQWGLPTDGVDWIMPARRQKDKSLWLNRVQPFCERRPSSSGRVALNRLRGITS